MREDSPDLIHRPSCDLADAVRGYVEKVAGKRIKTWRRRAIWPPVRGSFPTSRRHLALLSDDEVKQKPQGFIGGYPDKHRRDLLILTGCPPENDHPLWSGKLEGMVPIVSHQQRT